MVSSGSSAARFRRGLGALCSFLICGWYLSAEAVVSWCRSFSGNAVKVFFVFVVLSSVGLCDVCLSGCLCSPLLSFPLCVLGGQR